MRDHYTSFQLSNIFPDVEDFTFLHKIRWKNERPKDNRAYEPTEIEHLANVVTHGLFVLPVIWFSYSLLSSASSPTQYWASVIYGAALIGLFSVSTTFHVVAGIGHNGLLREALHRGDRAMIYLFIAGAYTPWLTLRVFTSGGWSYELRWAVWVLATIGILYQQLFHEKYKLLETLFYVLIAVLPSLAVFEMVDPSGVWELQLGGVVYLTGVIFFKSDGRIPFAHAIWHLHVGLGTMIHYYAVSTYLVGPSNPL